MNILLVDPKSSMANKAITHLRVRKQLRWLASDFEPISKQAIVDKVMEVHMKIQVNLELPLVQKCFHSLRSSIITTNFSTQNLYFVVDIGKWFEEEKEEQQCHNVTLTFFPIFIHYWNTWHKIQSTDCYLQYI